MKLASVIVAAALAIPAVSSFAQSNQTLNRAEVKTQLVQLERAGYNPGMDQATYPAQIQAAEAKVAAQDAQNSYGGVAYSSSASGAPTLVGATAQPIYAGH